MSKTPKNNKPESSSEKKFSSLLENCKECETCEDCRDCSCGPCRRNAQLISLRQKISVVYKNLSPETKARISFQHKQLGLNYTASLSDFYKRNNLLPDKKAFSVFTSPISFPEGLTEKVTPPLGLLFQGSSTERIMKEIFSGVNANKGIIPGNFMKGLSTNNEKPAFKNPTVPPYQPVDLSQLFDEREEPLSLDNDAELNRNLELIAVDHFLNNIIELAKTGEISQDTTKYILTLIKQDIERRLL